MEVQMPTFFFHTGIKCKHEFCYDCLANYKVILKRDNSAHEKACPWHPTNSEELPGRGRGTPRFTM